MNKNNKNIFTYWEGSMPSLIPVLFETMERHIDRDLHILNDSNVKDYLSEIHPRYWDLSYTHKADYLRVNLVYHHGGIWLDADTLVMEPLEGLLGLLKTHDGFLVKETESNFMCNGVFGAKAHNKLLKRWANRIDQILDNNKSISRTELGSKTLNFMVENLNNIGNFHIFEGSENIYPVNWDKCKDVYLSENLDLLTDIKRPFQEVIVLVNSVYRALENVPRTELVEMDNVLGALLRESLYD